MTSVGADVAVVVTRIPLSWITEPMVIGSAGSGASWPPPEHAVSSRRAATGRLMSVILAGSCKRFSMLL